MASSTNSLSRSLLTLCSSRPVSAANSLAPSTRRTITSSVRAKTTTTITTIMAATDRFRAPTRALSYVTTQDASRHGRGTSSSYLASGNKPELFSHSPVGLVTRRRPESDANANERISSFFQPQSRISTNQAQSARPNILYRPSDLHIVPSGAALGAYMLGVSLSTSQSLIEPLIREIRTALVDHGVLIFPRQSLSEEHLFRFTSYFGTPQKPQVAMFPQHSNLPEFARPKFSQITYMSDRGSPYIPYHSDLSFTARPSVVTVFHCLQAPRTGGETKFANCYFAYQSLPQRLKEELKGKTAVHQHPNKKLNPREPVSHPLFPLHPITKEPVLYFSPYFTTKINGVSEEESKDYIQQLSQYAALPQNVYTHFWAAGDLVVWDNRATMHSREPFNDSEHRNMMRAYTIGDAPSLE